LPSTGPPRKGAGALGVSQAAEADVADIMGGFSGEADQGKTEIMRMLERRERDAEELDLESCFSEMRSKVAGDQAGVE
jgi:hypothetical protein